MRALELSEEEEEEEEEVRVVWRTGARKPLPPPSPGGSEVRQTPKTKRGSASAALSSPSVPGSSGERPQRKAKQFKKPTKNTGRQPTGSLEEMDQATLRLVSQLAMKMQARSHAGQAIPKSKTNEPKGAGTPFMSKTNRSLPVPLSSSASLGFSASKASLSRQSPVKTSERLAPSPRSKPKQRTPPPLPPPSRTVDPCNWGSSLNRHRPVEEEEDFDSYFVDESFDLALSQLDNLDSLAHAPVQPVKEDQEETGPVLVRRREDESSKSKARQETEMRSEKQLLAQELARKEIESFGELSGWSDDEEF